ncbi:type I secretion system permease/ATPase [Oceanicola sp. 22II-s10i]|uniref:type I secretion system permease/ATPase n=1 Tax=Oceanicola sp. 22II-s10i TaxID=1317116 RepID=UPI000B523697|nr:type I secretion system permease/ATPase [Oceanicola sp. 22II-s10i]
MPRTTRTRPGLSALRPALVAVALLSVALNLLALAGAFYSIQVFDRVFTSRSEETLLMISLLFGGILVVQAMFDRMRGGIVAALAGWLDAAIGPELVRSGLKDNAADGATGLRDLAALRNGLSGPAFLALADLPWALGFGLLLALLHPWLGLLALGTGAILLGLTVGFDLWSRPHNRRIAAEQGAAAEYVAAAGRAATAVEAMGLSDRIAMLWSDRNAPSQDLANRLVRRAATVQALVRMTRLAAQMAGTGLAGLLVLEGRLSMGVVVAVTILLARALAPIEQIAGGWRSLAEMRAARTRIADRIATLATEAAPMELPALEGRIHAEGVSFAVPGLRMPILQDLSFDLHPGEILGVIGPSGSGKSTLSRLILGLDTPNAGRMTLDGQDAVQFDRTRRGDEIGYLPQDVQLLPGTVAENIGRLSASADQIVAAARLVGVHEMILALPNGYDTMLAEGGRPLSGGQRQRIALARAVCGMPRLVVLDEPDSGLDPQGEAELVRTLQALRAAGSTVILIGHRMAAFRATDRLMVLDAGRIDLIGPRAEVMQAMQTRVAAQRPAAPDQTITAQAV